MREVLLIDDDDIIAEIITYYLSQKGNYRVTRAATAGEALRACRKTFDIVLLDIKLPDVDGVRLCARLREMMACPILLISCIDDEHTIVQGLSNGADDYITKPFDCSVLHARIEANLRRVALDKTYHPPTLLRQPGFTLDTMRYVLIRNGVETRLTITEYELLMYFIQHPNTISSAKTLFEEVWGTSEYDDLRTVMVHVHNLRKKLGETGDETNYIHTVRGIGYYYSPQPVPASGNPGGDKT